MDLHRTNVGVSVVASCDEPDCDWRNETRLFAEYGALADLTQRHVADTGHTARVEQHGPGSRYSPAVVPAYEGRAIGTTRGGEGMIETEYVEIERTKLQALLDVAIHSMDFGSGFWDREDAQAARWAAEALGLCPNAATPDNILEFFEPCEGTAVLTGQFGGIRVMHVEHGQPINLYSLRQGWKFANDRPDVVLPTGRPEKPADPFVADEAVSS